MRPIGVLFIIWISILTSAAARADCIGGTGLSAFRVEAEIEGGTADQEGPGAPCSVTTLEPLKFTRLAGGAALVAWNFGDGSAPTGGLSTSYSFNHTGDVTVSLSVVEPSGITPSALPMKISCWREGNEQLGIYVASGVEPLGPFYRNVFVALPGVPVTFSTWDGMAWFFDDGPREHGSGNTITHTFTGYGPHFVRAYFPGECFAETAYATIYVRGYLTGLPDALVILGAGRAGDWTTEIELANPTGVEQFGTIATVTTPDQLGGCPGACVFFPYHLPPNGTATVKLAAGSGAPEFVGAYYVVPGHAGDLPVVAARAIAAGVPSHALPVYRLNSLVNASVPDPASDSPSQVLVGARRSAGEHSNLLLSVLQPPGTVDRSGVPLRVDLLDATGVLIGSRDIQLGFGESRLIGDVVGALGVEALDLGQVRVIRTGGTNLVRATLATALGGGSVTISSGIPPGNRYPEGLPDAVVLAGGGAVGDWDTEILLGDSVHAADSAILAKSWPARPDPPRHDACSIPLPDSATTAVLASSLVCLPSGPGTVFVGRLSGALPETTARVFNRVHPARSADLPVATTGQSGSPNLVFPFAEGRLDLFLADMRSGVDADLQFEIRSAAGDLVGVFGRRIPAGGHILLGNVLEMTGASEISEGQIRVAAADGVVIWGALATLGSDGSFTITPGANP